MSKKKKNESDPLKSGFRFWSNPKKKHYSMFEEIIEDLAKEHGENAGLIPSREIREMLSKTPPGVSKKEWLEQLQVMFPDEPKAH